MTKFSCAWLNLNLGIIIHNSGFDDKDEFALVEFMFTDANTKIISITITYL